MSDLQYSEQIPFTTMKAAEKHALRLKHPDKLLEACAAAQEQIPMPMAVGDCGKADLRVIQAGVGRGNIFVDLISFLGPISNVEFVGEWVKLGFPPKAGFFTNSNTRIIGLGTTHVVLGATIAPGAGNIFAQLTLLEATTPKGPCVGLLPSGGATFI
jgi:hypothetical protein